MEIVNKLARLPNSKEVVESPFPFSLPLARGLYTGLIHIGLRARLARARANLLRPGGPSHRPARDRHSCLPRDLLGFALQSGTGEAPVNRLTVLPKT